MTALQHPSPPVTVDDASPALRPTPRTFRVNLAIVWCAAALVAAAGAAVLVGWVADVEVLKSLCHPSGIAMNPATAVAFLLAGTSLLLLAPSPTPARRRRAANAAAWAVLAVAGAKLLSVAGLPVAVDRWLFPARLGNNAMAPNSALALLLVATSLLLVDARIRTRYPTPWLAMGGVGMSLAALLGYAYDVTTLYRVGGFVPMALNSAICFFVLSVGVLAVRPGYPPVSTVLSDSVGGVLARRLLPAAVVVPSLIGLMALGVLRRDADGPELAVLLFTLATIGVFVALTAWTADRLHKLDHANRATVVRLQRAEAVYHSLVETLPQNIFRKDLTGRFTFGNGNFRKTLGKSSDEIVGGTDFDFYTPELAARYRLDDLEVARTGKTQDVVEEHVTPAGSHLYVQVIKTPVRSADDEVIGVQGIFWDVTDRVVAQQELERKNKLLQKVNEEVEDANNQLGAANARLYEANLQLEQANARQLEANARLEAAVASERAAREQLTKTQTHLVQSEKMVGLGQMVAGVAHEINNPLAFVTNNVAVLQRDVEALGGMIDLYRTADADLRAANPAVMARVDELAESIDVDYTRENLDDLIARSREGLRRIQQIVRDLRDFVRLDESELQEVDLNEGVESTLNIILGHAKKTQIKLEKDLGVLPPLTCYPAKVNQVIMNLVGNAIDASPEGSSVLVRTRAAGPLVNGDGEPVADAVPDRVVLEVIDRGCGIEPELRRRIFDPFFTTKPVGRGTGLGLSISYGIVRDHGGTIEVESEVGKGTTFRVTLPLAGPAKDASDRMERLTAKEAN